MVTSEARRSQPWRRRAPGTWRSNQKVILTRWGCGSMRVDLADPHPEDAHLVAGIDAVGCSRSTPITCVRRSIAECARHHAAGDQGEHENDRQPGPCATHSRHRVPCPDEDAAGPGAPAGGVTSPGAGYTPAWASAPVEAQSRAAAARAVRAAVHLAAEPAAARGTGSADRPGCR